MYLILACHNKYAFQSASDHKRICNWMGKSFWAPANIRIPLLCSFQDANSSGNEPDDWAACLLCGQSQAHNQKPPSAGLFHPEDKLLLGIIKCFDTQKQPAEEQKLLHSSKLSKLFKFPLHPLNWNFEHSFITMLKYQRVTELFVHRFPCCGGSEQI